jgi:glycosyltransferase involved in cell wall biosynthesis
MPALVSIIIPCHNAAPWLAATLESARAQTWPHTEIILVDDGSTDRSVEIAREFEDDHIRILQQPRRGASAARNAALAVAEGDFVQFLDADDLLASDKIALQVVHALELGGQPAICGRWSRFHTAVEEACFPLEPLCTDAAPVDWLITKFEQNRMMHPASWLISRPLIERAGPWNESLSLNDDGEYFTRIVLASDGVRFCSDALSFYRSSLPGSLSRSHSEQAWISAWRSLELCAERLLETENSPRTRHACATAFQRYIFEAYPAAKSCRALAANRVATLGGSELVPEGGPWFTFARKLVGWPLAKRLHNVRMTLGGWLKPRA